MSMKLVETHLGDFPQGFYQHGISVSGYGKHYALVCPYIKRMETGKAGKGPLKPGVLFAAALR